MALFEEKKLMGNGMVKEIEESAIGLVLQNLQQDQYQYPIKSFIREIVSNSVDAIAEREVAKSILSGESTVEDHFAVSESEITKDSQFKRDYYDLKFLSDNNEVKITYLNREGNRDRVIIEDWGVGLGGNRLKGFFKPAFSTKRLNKKALGKWGIGSKSGLSTGVESYQVITRYNGKEYQFDIYNDRYHSTTPKFDTVLGTENPYEIWKAKRYTESGTTEEFDNHIHYTKTDLPNGVTVMIDVKNPIRNKSKYIDAVKSQLTYFDNVKLFEVTEGEEYFPYEHKVQTEILYKDEFMIIPKENYYAVPHLVLNNVNYGVIDFAEMEMDTKKGNIGIIGDPSEIDVNQSRESVRYTEKTRDAIKKYLGNAINVAQNHLDLEFKGLGGDFLRWVNSCKNVRAKNHNTNSVFSRLSGLADLSNIEIDFTYKDLKLRYNKDSFKEVFKGFKVSKVSVAKNGDHYTTNTNPCTTWGDFTGDNLLYRSNTTERISAIKFGYIKEEVLPNPVDNTYYVITPVELESTIEELSLQNTRKREAMLEVFGNSVRYKNYEEIEVPQDFIDTYKEATKKAEEEKAQREAEAALTAKQIRDRDGRVLYHKLQYNDHIDEGRRFYPDYISTTKDDISLDVLNLYMSKETTIYGTKEDLPLLKACAMFSDKYERKATHSRRSEYILGDSDKLQLIMVSKDTVKLIREHATHVKEALQKIENFNTLTLMNAVVKYNTARQFGKVISTKDYEFLYHFKHVDELLYDTYIEVVRYASNNGFRNLWTTDDDNQKQIHEYFDKLTEFQVSICTESLDEEGIKTKAKEYFGSDAIENAKALDLEVYAKFKALEEYAEQLRPLFKIVSDVNSNYVDCYETFSPAVIEYLKLKNIPEFKAFLEDARDSLGLESTDSN